MKEENKLSVSEEIWNDIKDKHIEMFALANAKVSDYCIPVNLDPSRCFLTFKASSVLPALESAFGNVYEFEITKNNYIIVSKKANEF
jgi:hypothetical protein